MQPHMQQIVHYNVHNDGAPPPYSSQSDFITYANQGVQAQPPFTPPDQSNGLDGLVGFNNPSFQPLWIQFVHICIIIRFYCYLWIHHRMWRYLCAMIQLFIDWQSSNRFSCIFELSGNGMVEVKGSSSVDTHDLQCLILSPIRADCERLPQKDYPVHCCRSIWECKSIRIFLPCEWRIWSSTRFLIRGEEDVSSFYVPTPDSTMKKMADSSRLLPLMTHPFLTHSNSCHSGSLETNMLQVTHWLHGRAENLKKKMYSIRRNSIPDPSMNQRNRCGRDEAKLIFIDKKLPISLTIDALSSHFCTIASAIDFPTSLLRSPIVGTSL